MKDMRLRCIGAAVRMTPYSKARHIQGMQLAQHPLSLAAEEQHRAEMIISSTEEVGNMVVYACSPRASATTGAALRAEGGIVETIA